MGVYIDPEIAHVRMSADDADRAGIKFDTIKVSMSTVERAITDRETERFLKIIHRHGNDEMLGLLTKFS